MEKQKISHVHYDSTQYQAIYEQGEEALTVTTLNARRPWYSFSQSDWIKKDKASEFTGATYNLSLDTLREQRWIGRKEYELTDHLGNVLVTFLDRKTGYGNNAGNYIGFNADIASANDFYPFGQVMPNRSVSSSQYRFGVNGIERTDEVAGKGNHYTALFGEYSPRIARRWNQDPKPDPSISPYAMYKGNPILNTDVLLDTPIVFGNRLAGYRVEPGQGPIRIANDINNPKTQQKYGYSLPIKIQTKDIIRSNPQYFMHINDRENNLDDSKFNALNLNKGDVLELHWFTMKILGLEENTRRIQSYKTILGQNQNKISNLMKEINIAEQEFEIIKNSISDGADGDMGNAGGWGSISASMVKTKKVNELRGEIKKVEKDNEYYNSLIQGLEKDNKAIIESSQ